MMKRYRAAVGVLLTGLAVSAYAQAPVTGATTDLMSPAWAQKACHAWNADKTLTDKLAKSGWIDNDGGRGFKILRIYRDDCKGSQPVELRIAKQDGKGMCVYGGAVETEKLNMKRDYVMHASTRRWEEMGHGDYGPMKAMLFGRLHFEGPKFEAMRNMGPFASFLTLTGKVASAKGCPAEQSAKQ